MKKFIVLLLFSLIASPVFPSWDQFQKDAKHTAAICDTTISLPLCIKYKYPVQGGMIRGGSPLTDDKGGVYTNGAWGISKFDSNLGAVVWNKAGFATIDAPGMIYKNTVIYATSTSFRAHSLDTGNVVWEKNVSGTSGNFMIPDGIYNFTCFPSLSNGRIYCGNSAGDLLIVNADTGDTVKTLHVTSQMLVDSPAIDDDGTVYVGSNDNNLYAVDSNTGAIKWSFNVGGQVVSSPSIDDSGIYIMGGPFGQVWKLNKSNGSVIWTKTTGEYGNGSGALYGDGFFIASDDRFVYKFDKDTGIIKWQIYTEDNFAQMSCIVVCAKVFILGCIDKMIMIDADTGNKDFICHTLASNFTNLGYANGQLYFTSDDGNMYVVGHCDANCSPCTCDAHQINVTMEPTYFPPASPTPTPSFMVTITATYTITSTTVPTLPSTSTTTPSLTNTPLPTSTNTPIMPTATLTATKAPCDGITPPTFTVNMVLSPDAAGDAVINIESSVLMQAPPVVIICPHGVKIQDGNITKLCSNKSCFQFTAGPVAGETKKYIVSYPKSTGAGDIDSVTVIGTDFCGIQGKSDGTFKKSVISDDDVIIFKNVFRPDEGERCVTHCMVYANEHVTIKIYSRNGQLVKTLADNELKQTGECDIPWDGTDNNGTKVPSGIYDVCVSCPSYTAVKKTSVLR